MSKPSPEPSPQVPARETAETWAAKKKTPAWLFMAARTSHRWAVGRELTESEYDLAVQTTGQSRIGGRPTAK